MHRHKLAVAGLLLASPVWADETEMTAGGGAAGGQGAAAVATTSLVGRPYVAGSGKLGVYALYGIERTSGTNMMGMSATSLDDGFLVGAGYGMTPEITLGAQYGFRPGILSDEDSELNGPFSLFGMYQVIDDGSINVTATADFVYDLCGSRDAGGDCVGTKALEFGAAAKLKLSSELAVFTGGPIGPGPLGQQFKLSLEDMGKMSFDLPAGVMFQVSPELGVYLATNLMHINIANDDSVYFGADVIPVLLGGYFALDQSMGIEAKIELPDVGEGVDAINFGIGFRYYN